MYCFQVLKPFPEEDPLYPQYVCKECWSALHQFNEFYQKVENAREKFLIKREKLEVELIQNIQYITNGT